MPFRSTISRVAEPIPQLSPATARKVFIRQMIFFAALLSLAALENTFTDLADSARGGHPLRFWEPTVWEVSSNFVNWLLVPLVAWWFAHFPFNRETWWRSVPAHVVGTMVFSLMHTVAMVLLRQLAYRLMGERYDFGPFWDNWIYELRKDCLTYFVIVCGLMAFRTYGLWLEARGARAGDSVLAADATAADAESAAPSPLDGSILPASADPIAADPVTVAAPLNRLIVRKRNREFILDAADIDRIDADGNYVVVHSGGESYRVRDSLEGLAKRLGEQRFARVHRAHVVNIDRIREIQPWDHGDYRIVLKDGSFVNFSRRYRSRLPYLFQ
jgi:hypothetical protein